MSYNKFSASQAAPNKGTPEDKTEAKPAVAEPVVQPDNKQDAAKPAQKS